MIQGDQELLALRKRTLGIARENVPLRSDLQEILSAFLDLEGKFPRGAAGFPGNFFFALLVDQDNDHVPARSAKRIIWSCLHHAFAAQGAALVVAGVHPERDRSNERENGAVLCRGRLTSIGPVNVRAAVVLRTATIFVMVTSVRATQRESREQKRRERYSHRGTTIPALLAETGVSERSTAAVKIAPTIAMIAQVMLILGLAELTSSSIENQDSITPDG